MNVRATVVRLAALLLALPLPAPAAESRALLVTYGPEATNDSVRQVLFVSVPASTNGPLYLRIFDADCGGDLDSRTRSWDTRTRFALYGGSGATTAPGLRGREPAAADRAAGTVIVDSVFGVDAALNNKWSVLSRLDPAAGEKVGDSAVFKLVVEGTAGDDGNVFDVAVSADETRQVAVEGARVFSYAPSVRSPAPDAVVELSFRLPASGGPLTVSGFDLAGARFNLVTALLDLPLTSSGPSQWVDTTVTVPPAEGGEVAALTAEGGTETPNDASYAVSSGAVAIPLELPALAFRRNRRPVAVARTAGVSDCFSVALDASGSSDEDGEALDYAWSFGDGQSATGVRVTHAYPKAGTFAAQLTVSDASGQVARAAARRFDVVVNDPPRAEAGPDIVGAPGVAVAFDGSASSDSDGTVARYAWDFGDGGRGEGARPSHTYAKPGRYPVRLHVEDDAKAGCRTAEDELAVRINAPPTAIPGDDRRASSGEAVAFDGTRSTDEDGRLTAWHWDFGDGATAEAPRPTHAYTDPGTYAVSLTVVDDAGASNSRASGRLTVIVNRPPTADAGVSRRAGVGEVLSFDGAASKDADGRITSYRWDFGDGGIASGPRVDYAYGEPKAYVVTLMVSDDSGLPSGTTTATTTVTVNHQPVARAGGDRVVTSSDVRFDGSASQDADGTIVRYAWDFGDQMQAEGPTPVHVYRRAGTYHVRLTVTDDSQTKTASATDEAVVIVNQVPIADAGPDRAAAPGQVLYFSAAESLDPDGEVASYAWELDDGATGSGQAITHAFAAPGVYTVRLTVRDDSGHATGVGYDEARVRVNAPPLPVPGPPALAAPGQTVELDGAGSHDPDGKIVGYQWTWSDGHEAPTGVKARRKFERPGLYTAELTVTDDSGAANAAARARVTVRINSAPRARSGDDVVTCNTTIAVDGSASADPDGDPLAFSWDFGDGTPPQLGARAAHTYAAGGKYPVVLTVDDGTGLTNARATSALTVAINRPPTADAGGEQTACAGKPAIFSGNRSADPEGGALKHHWDFGDGTGADTVNPTKTYAKGGTYQATLTVTDDSGLACATGVDRIPVRVAEAPVADADADQKACANSEVRFDGSRSRDFDGLVNSYAWDFGDGTSGGGATPTHVFAQPGTYRVTLTVTGDEIGTCDNTDAKTTTVTVYAAPVARFQVPRVVSTGAPTAFDASASSPEGARFVSWKWELGDGETAEGERTTHTYAKAGRYFASLTVSTDSGTACSTTAARTLVIANAPPAALAEAAPRAGVSESVVFDASRSQDTDGSIVSYTWEFGDGQTATGVRVRHGYDAPGRYTARLTVKDDSGVANGTATLDVPVAVNAAPQPVITSAGRGCAGESVRFDAANSKDADGAIQTYRWDFGDGQTADGAAATHVYRAAGQYYVSLTAEDDAGVANSRNKSTSPFVVNAPPTADGGPDPVACAGEAVRFDGSRSSDRDGGTLTFRWDFGGGAIGSGPVATHTYAAPGRVEVPLEVDDGSGTSCAVTRTRVHVKVNTPPRALGGPDTEAFVGGAHDAVAFDATTSTDADGDPLTFRWDFGDGTADDGARVSHAYAKAGRYVVKLRVRDGTGTPCGEAWDEVVVDVKERP